MSTEITGAEWYERFVRELKKETFLYESDEKPVVANHTKYMRAAQRAAGLEETSE